MAFNNEVFVDDFCDADGSGEPLCCPVDGNSYKVFNGQCVPQESCPDMLHGSAVWQPLTDMPEEIIIAIHNNISNDGGYCCNVTGISPPTPNLCTGEKGCYLTEESVNTTIFPNEEHCSQSSNDSYCSVPTCSLDTEYSLCEKSTVCNEDVIPIRFDFSLKGTHLYSEYDVVKEEVTCYPDLSSGLISPTCDLSSCVVVNQTIFTPITKEEGVCSPIDSFKEGCKRLNDEECLIGNYACTLTKSGCVPNPRVCSDVSSESIGFCNDIVGCYFDKTSGSCKYISTCSKLSESECTDAQATCEYETSGTARSFALCDHNGVCDEVFEEYNEQVISTWRGACECKAQEEICITKRVINVTEEQKSSGGPSVDCNSYGCVINSSIPYVPGGCECTSQGCNRDCINLFSETRDCGEEIFCGDPLPCSLSSDNTVSHKCIQTTSVHDKPLLVKAKPKGEAISDDDFDYLTCSDDKETPVLYQGDMLCPDGYEYKFYDSGFGQCEKKTDVCDFGPHGDNTTKGCNRFTADKTDHWGLYNKDCVDSKNSQQGVYDWACCYDITFNDVDIYQGDLQEDYVKVY